MTGDTSYFPYLMKNYCDLAAKPGLLSLLLLREEGEYNLTNVGAGDVLEISVPILLAWLRFSSRDALRLLVEALVEEDENTIDKISPLLMHSEEGR